MEKSQFSLRTPSLQGLPSLPLKNFLGDQPGSSPRHTRWLLPGRRPSPHQGITLEVLLPLQESSWADTLELPPGPGGNQP